MSEARKEEITESQFQLTVPESTIKIMDAVRKLFHNEEGKNLFVVSSQKELEYLNELLSKMKGELKLVVESRASLTSPLESAKKSIIAEFTPFQNECADIERKAKGGMRAFLDAEDRKRRVAEAEAEERARKERLRLEKRADKAEAGGHIEKAEELNSLSMATQAAPVAAAKTVSGMSSRKVWSAVITDKKAFLKAAIESPMMIPLIDIDMKKLNKMAAMMKEEFDMPGAEAKSERSLSIRS